MPVTFKPLKNRALRDAVAAAIRGAIAAGQLRPGDPVPEAQIAEQMEISRSPVREAFRVLEGQGLLVTYPHRGTFVATFSEHDVRDIYQLRVGLESLAIEWAMARGEGPALARRLSAIVDRMRPLTSAEAISTTAELDSEFHEAIFRASGNNRLYDLWRSIDPFVWMMVGLMRKEGIGISPTLITEHEALVEAIAGGNPEIARQAIQEHILRRREVALQAILR